LRLVLMPQNGISLPFRLNILGQAKKRTPKRLTVHLAVSLGYLFTERIQGAGPRTAQKTPRHDKPPAGTQRTSDGISSATATSLTLVPVGPVTIRASIA